jgi:hypothetical protein
MELMEDGNFRVFVATATFPLFAANGKQKTEVCFSSVGK